MLSGTLSPIKAEWTYAVDEKTVRLTVALLAFVPRSDRVGVIERADIVAVVALPDGTITIVDDLAELCIKS